MARRIVKSLKGMTLLSFVLVAACSGSASNEPEGGFDLRPGVLTSPLLPGTSETLVGPRCAPWDEVLEDHVPKSAVDSFRERNGREACLFTYRYAEPITEGDPITITHLATRMASPSEATALQRDLGDWIASGTDRQQIKPRVIEPGEAALPGSRPPEGIVLYSGETAQSGGPQGTSGTRGDLVFATFVEGWPDALSDREAVQLARLAFARAGAGREAEGEVESTARVIAVRIHIEAGGPRRLLANLPSDTIQASLDQAAEIYNRAFGFASPELRFKIDEVSSVEGRSRELEFGRDTPRLVDRHSRDCRIDLFYVNRSGDAAGWAWVPQTSAFVNARGDGASLSDSRTHGRTLAHEFGHLFGLGHAGVASALMHPSADGESLTSREAQLVMSYLEEWREGCGR